MRGPRLKENEVLLLFHKTIEPLSEPILLPPEMAGSWP
jgi:hypothetical protein